MSRENGHVVQLGGPVLGQKPRIGAQLGALPRRLDADGTFEAAGVQMLPTGQALAVTRRDQYLDAEDLLAAIRQVVREEIFVALQDLPGLEAR